MRSQCSVIGATLHGVEAIPVTVEVVISNGLPHMAIVGMADTAVQEAKERVKAAIQAAGFTMPTERITVNLAPGSLRKGGTGFDLPIAIGLLAATQQIDLDKVKNKMFVGELSLEGPVRQVVGTLAFGICAKKMGLDLVSSGDQYVPIDGLEQLRLASLQRLHVVEPFEEVSPLKSEMDPAPSSSVPDFKDIAGHDVAKRALQVAAAGRHGVLMMGPPGSGKTMLASRMPSILPPLSQEEMLEAAVVHSVAGEPVEGILSGIRPFRQPHHTISSAGLLGGGSPIRPGEVSLSHCGVLFLDELSEFRASSLQGLRQPMENGFVNITRAEGNIHFPADFTLIAASNPCPCGYFGDDEHECRCSENQINRYQGRIGGPLMDRIDIQLDVRRLSTRYVLESGSGTDSESLREAVIKAREFAQWRALKLADGKLCRDMNPFRAISQKLSPKKIIDACDLSDEASSFITQMAQNCSLSGRGLINTLKVARTIADMEESGDVTKDHIAEALGLRLRSSS